ncbi:MAG: response regulator [Candidatus Omnitrophica bacterium]|nr:response regulator [Candidatus Omnitrophota bacterium]
MFNKIFGFTGISKREKEANSLLNILVVDDSEIDRTLIGYILKKAGYNVFYAIDGKSGLDAVKSNHIDLILLDCQMPLMGGVEMCRILKSDEHLKGIPVIFVTGIDTPVNVINCFEASAENFIIKPVNQRAILKHIKSAIAVNQTAKENK